MALRLEELQALVMERGQRVHVDLLHPHLVGSVCVDEPIGC